MLETMAQAKQAHKNFGGHFFDREAMRFFNSKVESELIAGRFFITSERFDDNSPKLFTIREIAPNGEILGDVGKFQEFETLSDALIKVGQHIEATKPKSRKWWKFWA